MVQCTGYFYHTTVESSRDFASHDPLQQLSFPLLQFLFSLLSFLSQNAADTCSQICCQIRAADEASSCASIQRHVVETGRGRAYHWLVTFLFAVFLGLLS